MVTFVSLPVCFGAFFPPFFLVPTSALPCLSTTNSLLNFLSFFFYAGNVNALEWKAEKEI